ncbi:MAG: hypothetical protein EOP56_09310 [Sphingobacteriales bacterium]|nr:MAG: hypothetical protein EOP56_09310 [Sphingobacteriales bacterium]
MKEQILMTPQQAKEAGYTHYVHADGNFEPIHPLDELGEFTDKCIVLVEPKPYSPTCDSAEIILEQLAEQMHCSICNESGDDTDDVYDAIKSIDKDMLQPFVDAVNEKLQKIKYYSSTSILLVNQQP